MGKTLQAYYVFVLLIQKYISIHEMKQFQSDLCTNRFWVFSFCVQFKYFRQRTFLGDGNSLNIHEVHLGCQEWKLTIPLDLGGNWIHAFISERWKHMWIVAAFASRTKVHFLLNVWRGWVSQANVNRWYLWKEIHNTHNILLWWRHLDNLFIISVNKKTKLYSWLFD